MTEPTRVTLDDVAQAAAVSAATASRVLNGIGTVRADLRERVLAAAASLSYAPDAHAQALARASSQVVGVICHDLADPAATGVVRGIMRTASELDLRVSISATFGDPEREIGHVAAMRGQRVRAILLVGSGFEDPAWQQAMNGELGRYTAGGGRVVAVGRRPGLNVDTVRSGDRTGARDLARTLVGLGHRDFAVLAGPPALTALADRLAGFREELQRAGLPLPPERIAEGAPNRDGGYAAAHGLLASGAGVTCVFAVTDEMAVGALAALRHHGVAVPGRMSLAGFGDIPFAQDLTPSLTTLALPLEDLGRRAVAVAVRSGHTRRNRVERIAGHVVLRSSVAPTPGGRR
jgi:LacI family transcriptional regulator